MKTKIFAMDDNHQKLLIKEVFHFTKRQNSISDKYDTTSFNQLIHILI